MALHWPQPKKSPPIIPSPDFKKHDLVFVLGMNGHSPNTSFTLCQVINFGYRLQQREYVYFCKTAGDLDSVDTIILCKAEYLRKPKFRAGTKLRVRDLDDRVNGVGIIGDWKVSVECLEFVNGKIMYWIKVPGAGRKKGSLLLDVEESRLEQMAAAVSRKRKAIGSGGGSASGSGSGSRKS
jgi:hypothetical protein